MTPPFTPSSLSDPSFKSAASLPMNASDLFEHLYLTPGMMTPLDDWSQSGLFDTMLNTDPAATANDAADIHSSLIQDAFLTSPCSTKDYLWMPSTPPEDLFNTLSTPLMGPTTNSAVTDASSGLTGLIDSLVAPDTPPVQAPLSPAPKSLPINPQSSTIKTQISPPLEMVMTLDTPIIKKKDASTKHGKSYPPAAAQPVASHITSASTPVFVLKQATKKRSLPSSSPTSSSSSSSPLSSCIQEGVSSELALKRQKNTDAARRSRLRKLQKMETMASRVNELEAMHQRLLARLSALETDKSVLLQKENGYLTRIEQLETDLSLAQKKITSSTSS